jgi:hypothetical protein
MKKSSVRLHVEEMESRLVPSGAPLHHPAPDVAARAATFAPVLGGTLTGTYTTTHGNPDTGTRYDLTGSGTLNLLGPVTAKAMLQSLGNVASGHAGGTVTITAGTATITLQLTGPQQKGFARLPKHFTYKVTSANGRFGSLKGQRGTVDLTLGAASGTTPGSFTLVIHPFTLVIPPKAK